MQDLGTLGGFSSIAYAINDRGQVVGSSDLALTAGNKNVADSHAFLWESGSMRDLGTLGGQDSDADAINERGQIIGTSDVELPGVRGKRTVHGFLWANDRMAAIGIRGPVAINERGAIAGGDRLWQSGKTVSLRPLVEALDLSDAGQVVGYCRVKGNGMPCIWRNGRVKRLPLLSGGDRGQAVDINARGQIVGWSNVAARQPERHAVVWERGTITDLGTLGGKSSEATDINNTGQIAGWSGTRNGNPRAVTWTRRTP